MEPGRKRHLEGGIFHRNEIFISKSSSSHMRICICSHILKEI